MIRPIALLALVFASTLGGQEQQPLQARAAVESQRVYVGQGFIFQIQVEGTDDPKPIDTSALEQDFIIQETGGGSNNSTSLTVVNGRMSQLTRHGYTYNYRLSARRQGTLTIPSLIVQHEDRATRTQPINILVQAPQENNDFKLRMTLSDQSVYVGQPVTLNTTWYVGREVNDYSFTMPLLDDRRFEIVDPNLKPPSANQREYMEIRLGDRRATARQSNGELNGRNYVTLQYQKILIPRAAGDIALAPSTVTFRSVKGYQQRRGLLDDFFSGSGFGRQAVYETLAIPSNRITLKVKELPNDGRPPTFSGLIGEYTIEADAHPTDVNVGDPITLNLKIGSKGYLGGVRLPPLGEQYALSRDFKIPEEMATGETKGRAKHFTQTIRAKQPDVSAIPPIELSYFDPVAAEYRTAKTEPIALSVKGTRIVTAQDAEGITGSGIQQTQIESSEHGIAHNYVDRDALVSQSESFSKQLRSPWWLSAMLLPPLTFFGFLGLQLAQGRESRAQRRARRAHPEWIDGARSLSADRPDEVLAALREFLGARLGLAPGALTFQDVESPLVAAGVSGDELDALKSVIDRCEAGRYAGAAFGSSDDLVADAKSAVDAIEEKLKERLR